MTVSRIEVRDQAAFQLGDGVLQQEFALLQTPQAKLIGFRIFGESMDRVVEVTMLDAQFGQSCAQLELGVFLHPPKLNPTQARATAWFGTTEDESGQCQAPRSARQTRQRSCALNATETARSTPLRQTVNSTTSPIR